MMVYYLLMAHLKRKRCFAKFYIFTAQHQYEINLEKYSISFSCISEDMSKRLIHLFHFRSVDPAGRSKIHRFILKPNGYGIKD